MINTLNDFLIYVIIDICILLSYKILKLIFCKIKNIEYKEDNDKIIFIIILIISIIIKNFL